MQRFLESSGLLLYCGLIYYLSAQSIISTPIQFVFHDKLQHFIAYAIMGLLAWRCNRHFKTFAHYPRLIPILYCSLYGASDEWHQLFVSGRHADIIDWIADILGASLTVHFLFLYSKKHSQ
ncbi:MAG: hypothetical protein RL637_1597 [Pseudomonadota bacterium]|jgi:VanZ family protein